jgi:hypothetical protein
VSVAEIIWEETARTVRDATGVWKDEEQGAGRALATDQLVHTALELVYAAQHLIMRNWDDLFSERIKDVEAMGHRLEQRAETTIQLAEGPRAFAALVEAEG